MTESSCSCMLVPRPRTNPPPIPARTSAQSSSSTHASPILPASIACRLWPPSPARAPPSMSPSPSRNRAVLGWGDGGSRAPSLEEFLEQGSVAWDGDAGASKRRRRKRGEGDRGEWRRGRGRGAGEYVGVFHIFLSKINSPLQSAPSSQRGETTRLRR